MNTLSKQQKQHGTSQTVQKARVLFVYISLIPGQNHQLVYFSEHETQARSGHKRNRNVSAAGLQIGKASKLSVENAGPTKSGGA
jgi:hypothetical protein